MANDRLINSTQGESIITGLNTIATKLDALKPVSAADNGKVVVNGELTAQTAYPTTVTENDTYDTTNYNSITVNVSGGGGAGGSDVIFYDYDGTVVASYSAADFANLSAMPANPTHTGLTAQGWNWSLSDAKTYVASYGKLDIGQMYITTDEKTRLYFTVTKDSLTVELTLVLSEDTELDIDWGDGSAHTSWISEDDEDGYKQHDYASAGRYTITIAIVSGSYVFESIPINNIYKIEIGSAITDIYSYSFSSCTELSSITIPNSVTSISDSAFNGCRSLSSITIPNSVTSIGDSTFYDCYSLSSVTIPNSVTSMGNDIFHSCFALSSVTIPNSVISMGSDTFSGCSALSSVTIPNSVISMGSDTFSGCYALSSVTIPDSVTRIGSGTFSGCSALSSVTIPDSVTSIGVDAFNGCSALSSVTIPNSVTSVGNNAFSNCYALSSVTIPDSVTSIGVNAFASSEALSDITFVSSVPPELSGNLDIDYMCIIHVPQGSLSAYTSASNYPDPSEYIYEEY